MGLGIGPGTDVTGGAVVMGSGSGFGQSSLSDTTTTVTPGTGFDLETISSQMHRSSAGYSLAFEHAEHPANLPFRSTAQDGTGTGVTGSGGDPPKFLHFCSSKRSGTKLFFLMLPALATSFGASFMQILTFPPEAGRKLIMEVHRFLSGPSQPPQPTNVPTTPPFFVCAHLGKQQSTPLLKDESVDEAERFVPFLLEDLIDFDVF